MDIDLQITLPELPAAPALVGDDTSPVDAGPWYYAQVDNTGRCTAQTQAAGPIDAPHMVPVPDMDSARLGQTYDGEQWTPAPAAEPERRITRLAFMQRFTDAEAVAIDLASIGATVQAAGVRRYLSLVNAASYIDLARPDTRAGVLALETAELIGPGRALEILDAPLADSEVPGGAL